MAEQQVAYIDGQEYSYTRQPEDGAYLFQVNGAYYRFRQWTWGEKNRVTDASVVFDRASGRMRIDIARFNELLLMTCLVEAETLAVITPETLRQLNPVLGDTLLAIAYWISELPESEKKSLISALREQRVHPDLTTFRLCQEFGWTPQQVQAQPAQDVEKFILILNELETLSALVPADEDSTTILITHD
jgi:hypothetical protein